jgi:2-C-methyl-D-erythritol 4-phosphate cytidylyltransferase
MNIAIIAAAGSGNRMASDRPKQFLELCGVPILLHTLTRFEQCESIQEVIVVLPAEESAGFLSLAGKAGLRKLVKVVPGGATRVESVKRGFLAIRSATAEIVAIHDGVRPFVTPEEIDTTVAAAQLDGAAILVSPANDTIKQIVDGKIISTLDRRTLRHALTPQCFQYALLQRAFAEADTSDPTLTDESALVEHLGVKVTAVAGNSRNMKITTPQDLLIAEAMIKSGVVDI